MTELLKLYMKTTRTLKKNPYRQGNSIHEQIVKRTDKER